MTEASQAPLWPFSSPARRTSVRMIPGAQTTTVRDCSKRSGCTSRHEVRLRRGSPVTGRQRALPKFIQNSSVSTTMNRQIGLSDKDVTRIMKDGVTRIEFRYDRLGGRLKWIGDTEIQYDKLGSRPKRVGDIELEYDKWGSRLKWVGSREVQYDWAGSRTRWLGDMELRYDKWGYRLKWVGGVELHYERWGLGSRLRWIGDLELGYEEGSRGWLVSRPKYIVLPDEHSQLSVEKLLLVFFVLYEENRREEERKRREGS